MHNKLGLPIRQVRPLATSAPRRRLNSESLFAGGFEVIIVHGVQEYRLLRTRHGKLILNK